MDGLAVDIGEMGVRGSALGDLSGREAVCAAAMHRDSLGLAAYIMKIKMQRRKVWAEV